MNYQKLKVGDVRKTGDEVRPKWNSPCNDSTSPPNPCNNWISAQLVGWPILPSDLFNAEFRRPI